MPPKTLLLFLALLAIGPASAQTSRNQSVHFYVQPALVIADLGENFESAGCLAGAVGVAWSKHHACELEYTQFKAEPTNITANPIDLDYSLILATYKYSFLLPHGFAIYVGGSVGQANEQAHARTGYVMNGETSDNASAYGLTSGVSYTISQRIILDGGIKHLHIDKTNLTTSGKMLLIHASVRFQF